MVDASSRLDAEMRAKIEGHRDLVVAAVALNQLRHRRPGPLAHTALRGFLEFAVTALDLGREAGLEPEPVVAVLQDVLLATVESVRSAAPPKRLTPSPTGRGGHCRNLKARPPGRP